METLTARILIIYIMLSLFVCLPDKALCSTPYVSTPGEQNTFGKGYRSSSYRISDIPSTELLFNANRQSLDRFTRCKVSAGILHNEATPGKEITKLHDFFDKCNWVEDSVIRRISASDSIPIQQNDDETLFEIMILPEDGKEWSEWSGYIGLKGDEELIEGKTLLELITTNHPEHKSIAISRIAIVYPDGSIYDATIDGVREYQRKENNEIRRSVMLDIILSRPKGTFWYIEETGLKFLGDSLQKELEQNGYVLKTSRDTTWRGDFEEFVDKKTQEKVYRIKMGYPFWLEKDVVSLYFGIYHSWKDFILKEVKARKIDGEWYISLQRLNTKPEIQDKFIFFEF